MDPYRIPMQMIPPQVQERHFPNTYFEERPPGCHVASSLGDRGILFGAAIAKFITFVIMLAISIYLECERYHEVGSIAAAVNTHVTVGGVSSVMAMIAAARNRKTLHVASLTLAAGSVFVGIQELMLTHAIYKPGEDLYLTFLHLAPFDLSCGLILLGVQGAIIADIRLQRNQQIKDFSQVQAPLQNPRQNLPNYIRSS